MQSVDSNFWHGRRVFVTGHTGFKGGWLCLWLWRMGAEVYGYALPPDANPSLYEAARIGDTLKSTYGDVRDLNAMTEALARSGAEIVFHMAAQPLVRLSYQDPLDTYSTNVMGTANLLEAVRRVSGVRAVVNVTTDKCYENREWVWGYREDEALGGYDPYSSSKACSEIVTSAYRRSFLKDGETAVASARAGNVIGGGDWSVDRLIPDILRAVMNNTKVRIRNPNAIRPWQHVLEPLSGYLLLAERLATQGQAWAEAWNFGPRDADAKPVQWIVEKLVSNLGRNGYWSVDPGEHPHEAHFLKLDISKASSRLGWEPRWSLECALTKITDWHTQQVEGKEPRDICLSQIQDFQDTQIG